MSLSFVALLASATPLAEASAESTAKRIARTEIEQFESAGDVTVAGRVFTADYQLHFPGMPPLDAAGHAALLQGFRAAFPDLSIEVVGQIADGDRVANHWVLRGTQRGDFQGLPATGRAVEISGSNIMRFEDGRIAETWGYMDAIGMMQQLGAMPAGPPPAIAPGTPLPKPVRTAGALQVVERFVAGFNRHDPVGLSVEFDPSYVLDFPGGPTGTGVEGIQQATAGFLAGLPDLVFHTEEIFAEGDQVAWRWRVTATQTGTFGPVPPSGRPVDFGGISLLRVQDGRIVEDRVRADLVALFTQIGAIPPR